MRSTSVFKKISELLSSSIYGLSAFLFAIIFIIVVFVDRSVEYLGSNVSILPNLISVLIIVALLVLGIRYRERIKIQFTLKTILIVHLILFIIQVLVAYSVYFYTGWDAATVRNTAFQMVEHADKLIGPFAMYYSYHVNQTTIAIFLSYIMRFFYDFGIGNYYFGTVLVSVLFVWLSSLFLTLSVRKLSKSDTTTLFAFILFLFLGALSPWITIPYSDTYAILFPSFALFTYVHTRETKWFYPAMFLISLASVFGALIKPQTIIVLIAVVIVEIIEAFKHWKKGVLIFSVMLISILFARKITNEVYYKSIYTYDFGIIQGRNFTYTHYLMMGLNPVTYGVYSIDDTELSYGTGSVEEREAKNWEVIQERIQDYGVLGYLDFSMHKILTNFNDGTFAWNGEGGFYAHIFEPTTPLSNFLRTLYYIDAPLLFVFFQITQWLWLLILGLIPLNLLNTDKSNKAKLVIILSVIGISLFTHLFEARARYLFLYLPFFVAAASFGFETMINRFKKETLH